MNDNPDQPTSKPANQQEFLWVLLANERELIEGYETALTDSVAPDGLSCLEVSKGDVDVEMEGTEMVPCVANIWLTMLQQAGVPIQQFRHSTGTVDQLPSRLDTLIALSQSVAINQ